MILPLCTISPAHGQAALFTFTIRSLETPHAQAVPREDPRPREHVPLEENELESSDVAGGEDDGPALVAGRLPVNPAREGGKKNSAILSIGLESKMVQSRTVHIRRHQHLRARHGTNFARDPDRKHEV